MDLEVAGLVRGGLPPKLPPGGQAPQTACFLSVLAPVLSRPLRPRLLPSGWGSFVVLRSQSTQCAGPSPSDSSRIRDVAAPPRLPTESPRWFVLGKVFPLPACFEPPCIVSNLESVVLACLVFFPADKYVGSEACHGVGF